LTRSTPGAAVIAQGIPNAALAGPVGAIVAQIDGDAAGAAMEATVVVAVGLTSGAIGAAPYLLLVRRHLRPQSPSTGAWPVCLPTV